MAIVKSEYNVFNTTTQDYDTHYLKTSLDQVEGSAALKEQIAKIGIVGEVLAFAGATCPSGYLFCDGSALSRTDYKKLFDVIGTSYGVGDGSTTFNLPNLVDKFIQGNATVGSVKSAGLPNIEGTFKIGSVQQSYWAPMDSTGAFSGADYGSEKMLYASAYNQVTWYKTTKFDASKSSSIYGNSTTVQPPAVTMQYIIRYE